MTEYLSIGQVSEITHISTRRLRYYDEHGLVCPAYRDPDTGYRYYTPEQVTQLKWINYLRALDIPVNTIKDFRGGDLTEIKKSLDTLVPHLQQQSIQAKYRYDQTSQLRTLLGVALTHIRSRQLPRSVTIMTTEPFPTLYYECDVDSRHMTDAYRLQMFNTMDEDAQKYGFVRVGGLAIVYRNHHLLSQEKPSKTEFHFQIQSQPPHTFDRIGKTGGYTAATAVHLGPYETLKETYGAILRWAKEQGIALGGNSLEEHIITSQMVDDPDKLVTQVFIPILDQPMRDPASHR